MYSCCVICLDPLDTPQSVALGCGHLFHKICVDEQKSCPLCRKTISCCIPIFLETAEPLSKPPELHQRLEKLQISADKLEQVVADLKEQLERAKHQSNSYRSRCQQLEVANKELFSSTQAQIQHLQKQLEEWKAHQMSEEAAAIVNNLPQATHSFMSGNPDDLKKEISVWIAQNRLLAARIRKLEGENQALCVENKSLLKNRTTAGSARNLAIPIGDDSCRGQNAPRISPALACKSLLVGSTDQDTYRKRLFGCVAAVDAFKRMKISKPLKSDGGRKTNL